ncbi:transposase [Streptomyces incanus]
MPDRQSAFSGRLLVTDPGTGEQCEVDVLSGVEGTINEFAHGHGVRRCRYRGQPKAHLQPVLTAIAVNIEPHSHVG